MRLRINTAFHSRTLFAAARSSRGGADKHAAASAVLSERLVSAKEDVAVIKVVNGKDLPITALEDEAALKPGAPVVDVSYAWDFGKLSTYGMLLGIRFPHFTTGLSESYPEWFNAMPVDNNQSYSPSSISMSIPNDGIV